MSNASGGARSASSATTACAQHAADEALSQGGSAADAVVAGFFALAGHNRRALLAPTIALVAGLGAPGRAIDGRAAQPGLGVARPRGIREDEPVPLAAYAAVSRSIHAVTLLHAEHGRRTLAKAVAAGIAEAKSADAPLRANFLRKVGGGGATAIGNVSEALLKVAGVFAGGLLTEEDISRALPSNDAPRVSTLPDASRVLVEPWEPSASKTECEVIAAADGFGLLAAIVCFANACERNGEQLVVPEIDVALPLIAEPVRRGKTRVAPGTIFSLPRSLVLIDGQEASVVAGLPRGFDEASVSSAFSGVPMDVALRSFAGEEAIAAVMSVKRGERVLALLRGRSEARQADR